MINPNININRVFSMTNRSFIKSNLSSQEFEAFLKELRKIAIKFSGRKKTIISQILNHIASGTTYLVKPDPDLIISKKLFEDSKGKLNRLVDKIRRQAPTLDIIKIIEDNMPDTSLDDKPFIDELFNTLDTNLAAAIQPFQNYFIGKYKASLSSIATDFGIQNPLTALQNAVGEFASNLTNFDPAIKAFAFATNNLDKSNKTRYPGVSGLYKEQDYKDAIDKELQNSINYKSYPLNPFAEWAIDKIVRIYKNSITHKFTFPASTVLKDIQVLRKGDVANANLDQLNKVFPGFKAIIEKLQKHSDGNLYGKFKFIDQNPANILNTVIGVDYVYKGTTWNLISPQTIKIIDIKSPVQTAKIIALNALKKIGQKKLDFSEGDLNKVISGLSSPNDFATAFKKGMNIPITPTELENLIKEKDSQAASELKSAFDQMKIDAPKADKTINISLNNITHRLAVNIEFKDNTIPSPDPLDKDQMDSVQISTQSGLNLNAFSYLNLLQSEMKKIGKIDIPWYNLENYKKGTNEIFGNWYIEDNPKWRPIKNLISKWVNDFSIPQSRFTFIHKYNKASAEDEISVTDSAIPTFIGWNKFKAQIGIVTQDKNLIEKAIINRLKGFHGKIGSILDSINLNKSNGQRKLTIDQMNDNLVNRNNSSFKDLVQDIKNSIGYELDWGDIKKIPVDSIDSSIKNKWGTIFTFSYNGIDAFANIKPTAPTLTKDPNFIINRALAYRAASIQERNKALTDLQEFAKNQKIAIDKVPLQTKDKKILIEKSKKRIDKIVEQFEIDISMQENPELSKTELTQAYSDAENKIKMERLIIEKSVSMKDLIKRFSKIYGGNIPPSLISAIQEHPDVFLALIDKTHDKKIIDSIAKNKALLENLDTLLDMPGFDGALTAVIKSYQNYSYAYFGTGVAAGIIGIGAGGAAVAALRANSKINKLKNKKIKIKGSKMIVWITSIISLGSIASSIALLVWFFVSQGGF